jgi:RNA polymerase sigma-70 factor (ECF subfamily)
VEVDRELFRDRLDAELDRLDPDHKATFVMRFHEELAIKEIAAAFGCSEGTVKSRIFYTLKKLAERLKEFDPNALNDHGKARTI